MLEVLIIIDIWMCKVIVVKYTLGVYEQFYTHVHQCVHIEVTANISKDIKFKEV